MQKGIDLESCSSVDAPIEVHKSTLSVRVPVCVSSSDSTATNNLRHTNENMLDNLARIDEKAFNAIYDKYVFQLINFSRQLLERKEDAEDVVADVFFNLWKLRDRFFSIQNIKAFLYASVRNCCVDILRRTQTRNTSLLAATEESADIPDQILIEAEYKSWLRAEIERLPDQRQLILKLAIYEGKKTNEIAELLNIAPKTVSNQKKAAFEMISPRIKAITATLFSIIPIITAATTLARI